MSGRRSRSPKSTARLVAARPPAGLLLAGLLLAATTLAAGAAAAAEWRLDPARSVFAVLTHKAGFAARLAHDHVVVAVGAKTALDFDPERPQATRFSATANVLALEVDAPASRAGMAPRFAELGALATGLPPVDPDDRVKVRAAMLGRGQLDAADFPELAGELVALAPRAGAAAGSATAEGDAQIRLTVRGRTVAKTVRARWRVEGGVLTAEALGEFTFTEFGITPYSAVLGAVRNQDPFQLYVRIVARPAVAPPAAAPPPG